MGGSDVGRTPPDRAATVLAGAVGREAIAGDGKSGSSVERLLLADGTSLVVKHVSPYGDWIMRQTHDDGRVARLWRDGILGRVPEPMDHTIVAVEEHEGGWVVVMRDETDHLVHGRRLDRAESRRIITAAAALHDEFRDDPPDGLCPLDARYTLLGPSLSVNEPDEVVSGLATKGWEVFADEVRSPVTEVVLGLLDDPAPLVARLAARDQTLIHGDLKLGNLGLAPDRVIVVDWGTQTGRAPAAVEWAWYVALCGNWIDARREDVLADCRAASGVHHDEDALDFALLGALVQLGWNKALDAHTGPDPETRASERADLEWWVATAEGVLERHGSV